LRAALAQRLLNIDEFRHGIERMDPLRYLEAAYYDRWYTSVERILIEKGVVTEEELEARSALLHAHPAIPSSPAQPPAAPAGPAARPAGRSFRRDGPPPAFRVGDQVVTRAMHPRGHTRLPRYARGKRGVIQRVHAVFVFPDTNAHGLGEQPQAVYSVRFDARELWADAAEPQASVALDLWESYLEAAPRPDTERAEGSQSR
jgi:nitrile hydratase